MNRGLTRCVVRHGDSCLAVDAVLVGEIVPLAAITRLARCPAAVLGLTDLRGQPLPVVDLGQLLEFSSPAATGSPARQLLVLRTEVRLAGLPIDRCEGVLAADPADYRQSSRHGEPSWVAGFQAFPSRGLLATVIDSADLLARLGRLRFQPAASNAA
ncbi:hypothetical protein LBMAG53_06820 [Planctomycetota bacterium]|nr:hypothetical protein LBMAG53_06820 [Planctomycetota bacterium]